MTRLVAIISSAILVLGGIFPWFQYGIAQRIYHISNNYIIASGICLLVISINNQRKKEVSAGLVYITLSISCLVVTLLHFMQIGVTEKEEILAFPNNRISFLISELLVLLGSIGSLISGFIIYKTEDKTGRLQGKVAIFMANRIAFNRQRSFSRFIIRLSIVATTISVAVMLVTLAFTNGFQETVSQKIFSFWGHIRVQYKQPLKSSIAEEEQIEKNDTVVQFIKQNPNVISIHPFATKYAILKTKDEMDGVLMKGLDSSYDFDHIQRFLKKGRWLHFNDTTYSREIIISSYIANELRLDLNDKIVIYFIRPDGSLRPDKLSIVGIYKTGIEDYDKVFAIGDLKLIQRLNGWQPNEIGGYEIFLKDYHQMQKVSDDIYYTIENFPSTWDTKTTRDLYPNIFDWLGMQDVTRDVLIGFMVAVAVINLITCLIILVLERIRMVGVLKALGARNWTVQNIFLQHSTIITITGIILGALFGLGLCWLQQSTGFIKLNEEAYYMTEAAVKIVWWQVALICGCTLVICFLVLMIPSIIVRKVRPVKAIQFR
jgi:lipoprotein-releasing system permease protein